MMKKRIFSALLVLALALTAALPAMAAENFSDVTDKRTAQNVEILYLLGVLDGDGTGHFNPTKSLTRAEFCKMVVALSGSGDEAARYKSVTIFPDVRASHWSAGYVNLAVRQLKLLAGLPDGTFRPDRAISYGEAVTILMRMLGYSDSDSGGIWPDGYIQLAKSAGVSDGVELAGSAEITRAQAAQLFVNLLLAEKNGGGEFLPAGCSKGEETTLVALSGSTMRTSGSGKYDLARASTSTVLNGAKGYVILNADGDAATFVPKSTAAAGTTVSGAAVILSANGSTNGISALTGGRTDYDIYRNGVRVSASALQKNDVVTYDATSNTVYACDTRVTVYYEACLPSPDEAVTVEVLGGTTLSVLPTAQQSLAKFKPGKQMTLLLTNDGEVAGAVEAGSLRANALGVVDAEGGVQLLCGSTVIDLTLGNTTVSSDLYGKAVSISASSAKRVTLIAKTGGVKGDLNVREKTLGSTALSESVMLYQNGELLSLVELTEASIPAASISYIRTDANGAVDLIVLAPENTVRYGRVAEVVEGGYESNRTVTIDVGGKSYTAETGYAPEKDSFVEVVESDGIFKSITVLTRLKNAPKSAWIGTAAVNYNGATYTIAEDVLCRNLDNGSWMESLEAALAYGGTIDLYVKDGCVRVVTVRS